VSLSGGVGDALTGRRVVVTRPVDESRSLVNALQAVGAIALQCPAIEIEPIDEPAVLEAARRALQADDVIFVSPSAVRVFFALLAKHGLVHHGLPDRPLPSRIFTIGPGSAGVLAELTGCQVLYPHDRHDSAALLAMPELAAVAGRTVALIGGEGGRTELARTLTARGADLRPVICYRRRAPAHPALADWLRGAGSGASGSLSAGPPDAIVITSSEGLNNLWQACDDPSRQRWCQTPTVVPHARIAAVAQALGLRKIDLADAGDAGIVAALERFFR
jgi:uroporphyrinogen-III synthase